MTFSRRRSAKRGMLLLAAVLLQVQKSDVSAFSIVDSFHLVHQTATHAAIHTQAHAPPHHLTADVGENLLNAYKHTLHNHPLPTKMITGATLAVSGDAIAQSQDKDKEYDVRRAGSFAAFDMAYRALQHVAFPIIVTYFHGQFLGGAVDALHLDHGYGAAMEQTLASQLGIVPFLYYPAFFSLTGLLQGLDGKQSFERAQAMFLPLMQRNLLFWIPVQFIQFGFIEESLQIPFLSAAGLCWTFILSVMAGSAKSYSEKKDVAAEEPVLASAGSVQAAFNPDTAAEDVLAQAVTVAITEQPSQQVQQQLDDQTETVEEESSASSPAFVTR